jgi:hypothetical protein
VYYKMKRKEIDLKIKNWGRKTKLLIVPSDILDIKKFEISFAPNYTHYWDGEFIRLIHAKPYDMNLATIHDCYIVSIYECGKLIKFLNNIFQIRLNFDHVSLTILL